MHRLVMHERLACLSGLRKRGWGRPFLTPLCVWVCVCGGVRVCVHKWEWPAYLYTPNTNRIPPPPSSLPGFPTTVARSHLAELHSADPGCYLQHGSTSVYLPSPSAVNAAVLKTPSPHGQRAHRGGCLQTLTFNGGPRIGAGREVLRCF